MTSTVHRSPIRSSSCRVGQSAAYGFPGRWSRIWVLTCTHSCRSLTHFKVLTLQREVSPDRSRCSIRGRYQRRYPRGMIMKVLLAGAAGNIGRAIGTELRSRGHQVIGLTRSGNALDGLAIPISAGDVTDAAT